MKGIWKISFKDPLRILGNAMHLGMPVKKAELHLSKMVELAGKWHGYTFSEEAYSVIILHEKLLTFCIVPRQRHTQQLCVFIVVPNKQFWAGFYFSYCSVIDAAMILEDNHILLLFVPGTFHKWHPTVLVPSIQKMAHLSIVKYLRMSKMLQMSAV